MKNVDKLSAIERIDYYLSLPDLKNNSNYTITDIGNCQFAFVNEWSKFTSNKKGYHKVQTKIIVDKSNYLKTEFEKAHKIHNKNTGKYENWEDTIRIRLSDQTEGIFSTWSRVKKVRMDEKYSPTSIPFGINNVSNETLIHGLIKAVDDLIHTCNSTPA